MKKARDDGSDDAKAFIDREAANEFAALREMKVILKELKDKVELEDTLNMEVAIFDYEKLHGYKLSTSKVQDFPKDAYKK